jgi:heat shock protein HtpX
MHASFTTRLRTWVLVAGLSALLVGFGATLGGGFLYLFVGLAIVMNFVGYWFSDRIALKASRAQPLDEAEAPELHRIVRDLAERAKVPMPRLYLIPAAQPNAFATGRNPKHSAVAVTEGLLQAMPIEQVRAVLAHEFAHIKNRDILVASIAAMIAASISAIANILQFQFLFGDDEENPLGFIGTIAAMMVAPIAAMLLQLAVSRQREYLADATAKRMLGEGESLADALESLERGTRSAPIAINPAVASLYIANPLPRTGMAMLFSTHPPIPERVRRLRAG